MAKHGTTNFLWKLCSNLPTLPLQLSVLPVPRIGAFHGTNITFSKLLSGPTLRSTCSTCQVKACSDMFGESTMIRMIQDSLHLIIPQFLSMQDTGTLWIANRSIEGLYPTDKTDSLTCFENRHRSEYPWLPSSNLLDFARTHHLYTSRNFPLTVSNLHIEHVSGCTSHIQNKDTNKSSVNVLALL